jgi:hypothetical protein
MQKYAASLGGESALEAKRRGRNGEGETARAKRRGRNGGGETSRFLH